MVAGGRACTDCTLVEVSGSWCRCGRRVDESELPLGGILFFILFWLIRYGNHVRDGDCVSGSEKEEMGLSLGK